MTTSSTSCTNCDDPYFDQSASDTYTVVSEDLVTLEYGSATLEGYFVTDQVCLNKELWNQTPDYVCAEEFKFYMITEQVGLEGLDGILGLSPPDEAHNGPSYVKALYD